MGTSANVHSLFEAVHDRESFFAFVYALMADLDDSRRQERITPSPPYSPGANGWENGSIGRYLEAALAWAGGWPETRFEHDDGRFPSEPSWKAFANFLYAGKFYE
jgi:hypothetical protein